MTEEVDRTKLKSFQDISHLQARMNYSGRRQKTLTMPPTKRLADGERDPFTLQEDSPPRPVVRTCSLFKTLTCERKKKTNLKGKRQFFRFFDAGTLLFTAKYKDGKDFIPIVRGENVHMKATECEAMILCANNMCDFSLRRGDRCGAEMMSIQIRRFKSEASKPRSFECFMFGQTGSCPNHLKSNEPQFVDGIWEIDLNSEDVMCSIKNCQLLSDDGRTFCFIRKMAKSKLEIESRASLDDLRLFAMAIGSFLCKR